NAAVPNDKYRPDIHSRPPRSSDTLLDLRSALKRKLTIDGAHAAHYFLEDSRGVRLADFHNAPGQTLQILRPPPNGLVYLRGAEEEKEFVVPAAPELLAMADLEESEPRTRARGAAQDSFNLLFSMPFDKTTVAQYTEPEPPAADTPVAAGSGATLRKTLGW